MGAFYTLFMAFYQKLLLNILGQFSSGFSGPNWIASISIVAACSVIFLGPHSYTASFH
jgi:hypothetical protein